MSDSSVAITAGTGTNIDVRTEATNGDLRQVVVLGDPSVNAGVAPVDASHGLRVNLASGANPVGKFIPFDGTNNLATQANPMYVLATMATLPVVANITNASLTVDLGANNDVSLNAGTNAIGKLAANDGVDIGDVTLNNSSIAVTESGTWTIQPGNTPNTTAWLVTQATLPVQVGTHSVLAAGGSLTAFQGTPYWQVTMGTMPVVGDFTVSSVGQGSAGSEAWLATLATLPVMAEVVNTLTVNSHAVTNAGTFAVQAAQSGTYTVQPGNTPNTTAWLATLATLPVVANIVNASIPVTGTFWQATQPISGTVTSNQGNSGNQAWLTTQATLPVVANINNSTIAVTESGTWTVQPGNTPNTIPWLVTMATLPVVTSVSVGDVNQGTSGSEAWLATLATLPVMANVVNTVTVNATSSGDVPITLAGETVVLGAGTAAFGKLAANSGVDIGDVDILSIAAGDNNIGNVDAIQSGTWTVQPGNTPNTTAWLVTMGTLPITGSLSVAGQATVTAIQGDAGSQAWPVTLATLSVIGDFFQATQPVSIASVPSHNVTNAGTFAVQSAQSGTYTVQPGNTPNTVGWLVTMATIPVQVGTHSILAAGGSLSAAQLGTWTVQPGNTPNTTAWLATMATLPVMANITNSSIPITDNAGSLTVDQPTGTNLHTVVDSGTIAISSITTLASGTRIVGMAQYLPTLASMADQGYVNQAVDLFGNLRVNTNVALPNSTKLNRFYTLASMASLMAAPGAGKRLVVRELDFSGNATLAVKLVEDQGGTPATVWGPHYFLPYSGITKTQSYIPITANKSLGVDMQPGGFNATIDVRVETENV